MSEGKAGGRKRLSTEDRRAQLLDIGLDLYAERGFADVPIDEIARLAKVSKGLLYHYFSGKRGFFVAVVEHAADRVIEALEPDLSQAPADRALTGIRAFLELVAEREAVYLTLMRGAGGDPDINAAVERVRGAVMHRVVEQLGLDPERVAFRFTLRTWLAGVEAGVIRWLEHREFSAEELVQLFGSQLQAALRGALALDPEAKVDFATYPRLAPD